MPQTQKSQDEETNATGIGSKRADADAFRAAGGLQSAAAARRRGDATMRPNGKPAQSWK